MNFDLYINNQSFINLRGVTQLDINSLTNFLKHNKQITHLNLSNCNLKPNDMTILGRAITEGCLSSITHLDISHNKIPYAGYQNLYLALSSCKEKTPQYASEALGKHIYEITPQEKSYKFPLTTLDLSQSIGKMGFHMLMIILIENQIKLKQLFIDYTMLDSDDMKGLINVITDTNIFQDLETLGIRNCGFNKNDITSLIDAAKIHMPKFTSFCFINNKHLTTNEVNTLNNQMQLLTENKLSNDDKISQNNLIVSTQDFTKECAGELTDKNYDYGDYDIL